MSENKAKKPVVLQHCRYCGAMTEGLYCKVCVREGWNEVHAMFGSTNGWDKKKGTGKREQGTRRVRDEARRHERKVGELVCGVWVDLGKKKRGETVTATRWRGRAVCGAGSATWRGSSC